MKINRFSVEYQALRNKVFERDNYRCVICGCTDSDRVRPLQMHFIKPRNLGGQITTENMLTVCTKHQDRGASYRGKPLEPAI